MSITHNIENEVEKVILGFTEEVTVCDCCGKADLKGTYAIEFNGSLSYFGSVCAFKVKGVTYEEQKEVKKEYKQRVKAEDKFKAMEADHNGTDYSLVKMLRFVEAKGLDLLAFINKYGKPFDETDYYTAYSIGHVVKMINKN